MDKNNLEDPEEWCTNDVKVRVEPECKSVRMCYMHESPGSRYSSANEVFQHNETLGACVFSREKQVLTSDCKYQSGYAIPNLELSLACASQPATLGNMSSHNVVSHTNKGSGFTNASTLKHHKNGACTSSTEKEVLTVHNEDQSLPVIPNLELSLGSANRSTTLENMLSSCNHKEKLLTAHYKDPSVSFFPKLELSLEQAKDVLLSSAAIEYKDKEANFSLITFKSNDDSSLALALTIAPPLVKNDK